MWQSLPKCVVFVLRLLVWDQIHIRSFFSQKLHEAASKCASEEEEAKKISPIQAENDVLWYMKEFLEKS